MHFAHLAWPKLQIQFWHKLLCTVHVQHVQHVGNLLFCVCFRCCCFLIKGLIEDSACAMHHFKFISTHLLGIVSVCIRIYITFTILRNNLQNMAIRYMYCKVAPKLYEQHHQVTTIGCSLHSMLCLQHLNT